MCVRLDPADAQHMRMRSAIVSCTKCTPRARKAVARALLGKATSSASGRPSGTVGPTTEVPNASWKRLWTAEGYAGGCRALGITSSQFYAQVLQEHIRSPRPPPPWVPESTSRIRLPRCVGVCCPSTEAISPHDTLRHPQVSIVSSEVCCMVLRGVSGQSQVDVMKPQVRLLELQEVLKDIQHTLAVTLAVWPEG